MVGAVSREIRAGSAGIATSDPRPPRGARDNAHGPAQRRAASRVAPGGGSTCLGKGAAGERRDPARNDQSVADLQ